MSAQPPRVTKVSAARSHDNLAIRSKNFAENVASVRANDCISDRLGGLTPEPVTFFSIFLLKSPFGWNVTCDKILGTTFC